jgi:N-acetylmuramoyl-L-alanine amidase
MRNQPDDSVHPILALPLVRFLRQHLPIVLFLVVAFVGMMAVYFYFTPEAGQAEAITAVLPGEGALVAPIFKNVPPQPVMQRLAQSPGPLRVGIIYGHRGFDSGAVCADGLTEVEVNTRIADMVVANLQARGIRTEQLDEFDPRLESFSGTAVVSIHADSCDYINDLATGFKIAGSGYTDSSQLSICVEQAYRQITNMDYHANTITPDMLDYHAFRKLPSGVPAIIIEVGFMNLDRDILTNRADVPASGVTSGILCFLQENRAMPLAASN